MRIVYENEDGSVGIVTPSPGERLCTLIKLPDGSALLSAEPLQADRFQRAWPLEGVFVQWAETEREFAERIAKKDVPKSAKRIRIVAEIALDRSRRNEWVFCEVNGVKLP